MTQRFARALEEGLFAVSDPKSVGTDDANAVSMYVPQSLPETLQAGERACGDFFVDSAVFFDACRETHHLAEAINHDQLTVRISRHDHMEAVRPKVDGG
jgi:hypothetical protein